MGDRAVVNKWSDVVVVVVLVDVEMENSSYITRMVVNREWERLVTVIYLPEIVNTSLLDVVPGTRGTMYYWGNPLDRKMKKPNIS